MSLMLDEPGITTARIAERLGMRPRTVSREIGSLKERGLVAREGGSHGGRWVVPSRGREALRRGRLTP